MRFYLFVVQHRLPFCNSLTKKSPLAEPDYLFYVCTTKVTNISLITIKLKNYGKESSCIGRKPCQRIGLVSVFGNLLRERHSLQDIRGSGYHECKTNSGLRLQTDDVITSLKGHEHEYDAIVFACGDAMPKFAENADKPYNVDMLSVIKNFAAQGKTIAGHCAAALLFDNLGIAQGRRVALYPFLKPVVKSCIGTDEKAVIDGIFYTAQNENTISCLLPELLKVLK